VGKRILVVDDSELILRAAAGALTRAGFDVTAVSDLGTVMTNAEERSYDLVLMDVQMPQLYGDDIASVLRNKRGLRGPIYLFSSLPANELAERVADAQLDGFISKNDGLDTMVARVRELLG